MRISFGVAPDCESCQTEGSKIIHSQNCYDSGNHFWKQGDIMSRPKIQNIANFLRESKTSVKIFPCLNPLCFLHGVVWKLLFFVRTWYFTRGSKSCIRIGIVSRWHCDMSWKQIPFIVSFSLFPQMLMETPDDWCRNCASTAFQVCCHFCTSVWLELLYFCQQACLQAKYIRTDKEIQWHDILLSWQLAHACSFAVWYIYGPSLLVVSTPVYLHVRDCRGSFLKIITQPLYHELEWYVIHVSRL